MGDHALAGLVHFIRGGQEGFHLTYRGDNYQFNQTSDIINITAFSIEQIMLMRVSGAGEPHPCALQDPYVTVSRHTAPTVQPMAGS